MPAMTLVGVALIAAAGLVAIVSRGPDDPRWQQVLAEATCCGLMIGSALGALAAWLTGAPT